MRGRLADKNPNAKQKTKLTIDSLLVMTSTDRQMCFSQKGETPSGCVLS